jgi:hypothetical protein
MWYTIHFDARIYGYMDGYDDVLAYILIDIFDHINIMNLKDCIRPLYNSSS